MEDGMIIFHNNATPHTALTGTSNFYLFGALKWHLSGSQFLNNDNVIVMVMTRLQTFCQDFFKKGFNAMGFHLYKCLNRGGDHVQKYGHDVCTVQVVISL
jgi:hypothetical protein